MDSSTGRHEPEIVKRLRRRRETHLQRGRVYRVAWVVAGLIVLAAGAVMVVLPGPALVVLPIGLAMLSLEFAWAQRLLEEALRRGAQARDRAEGLSRRRKRMTVLAAVFAVAAVVALVAVIVVYRT
jgi:uncharacterized protein (TIGR02611 family)